MISIILSTILLIRVFLRKIRDDHVAAYSAQAAFFIIISLFPFTMLLLSIVRYLPIDYNKLISAFNYMFPPFLNNIISTSLPRVFTETSITLLSIAAVSTLWSAGKGMMALQRGLNSVYDIKESRNYIFLRVTAAFNTFIFAIMLIATMILFVFGNTIYLWILDKFPILSNKAFIIISSRTLVGFITLTIFFIIIFIAVPNRKTTLFSEVPGAIIAATGWVGFSYIYSFYISTIANYRSMYGNLATVVFFMLWLYFCVYILFIGAEINAVLANEDLVQELKKLYGIK